jgi:hypothetical protein
MEAFYCGTPYTQYDLGVIWGQQWAPNEAPPPYDLSWLNLVCRPVGVVDRFDGLAKVVGQRVGGGDDVRARLDVDGAVAASGADELAESRVRW